VQLREAYDKLHKKYKKQKVFIISFPLDFSLILWHFAHMIILSAAVRLYAILGVI
jgi:hypothetical protein